MYEKLEVCPICKNTNFDNFLICTDHSISNESFALNKCRKCGFVFTNPRPDEHSIGKYYDHENYVSHANKSNSLINFLYKIVRKYTIAKKIRLLKKHAKGKKILDFGSGTGEFLLACKKQGYDVYGFEPNQLARRQSESKGLDILQDVESSKIKVDIITAWHVIEHVSDLKKTIKVLKRKLNDDGILLIAVPNLNSYDSQYYGEYWAALDVPRHLYHFTQSTFGKLIDKAKLSLIQTYPMEFDAYYVSLLSNKYRNQKNSFLNALSVGYKSNQKAKETGEYSSLIYVLKK